MHDSPPNGYKSSEEVLPPEYVTDLIDNMEIPKGKQELFLLYRVHYFVSENRKNNQKKKWPENPINTINIVCADESSAENLHKVYEKWVNEIPTNTTVNFVVKKDSSNSEILYPIKGKGEINENHAEEYRQHISLDLEKSVEQFVDDVFDKIRSWLSTAFKKSAGILSWLFDGDSASTNNESVHNESQTNSPPPVCSWLGSSSEPPKRERTDDIDQRTDDIDQRTDDIDQRTDIGQRTAGISYRPGSKDS